MDTEGTVSFVSIIRGLQARVSSKSDIYMPEGKIHKILVQIFEVFSFTACAETVFLGSVDSGLIYIFSWI